MSSYPKEGGGFWLEVIWEMKQRGGEEKAPKTRGLGLVWREDEALQTEEAVLAKN